MGRTVAALAQLVEHRIRNAGVTGSSPVGGTIPFSSIDRSLRLKGRSAGGGLGPVWGALGRVFSS